MRPVPTGPLLRKLRKLASIEKAWSSVRRNAEKSDSRDTLAELRQFEVDVSRKLKSIQGKLSRNSFVFAPARGVLLGKVKKRPIVIAPIDSRIVQRGLLDVIQELPQIATKLHAGFNFGGVDGPGFGVPAAVAKAVTCAQKGGFFVRSDIKSFFTKVPRQMALGLITAHTAHDLEFTKLLQSAVETELVDSAHLHEHMNLFPLYEEGVAQGSCLSPLLCNFLLSDFDTKMNARGITCIRYIDDFILFAKDKSTAASALRGALEELSRLGLSAYDPFNPADSQKAESGESKNGFEFLGCEITPVRIRPSKAKKIELLAKVQSYFDDALGSLQPASERLRSNSSTTFAGAIVAASNIVRGWGNTYSFCSDDRLMNDIDLELEAMLASFQERFLRRISRLDGHQRRRKTGLFSLAECKRDDGADSARRITIAYRDKLAAKT